MARTYKISEICGDWALQVKGPGLSNNFLFFKSRNNAEFVKVILEWEDSHPNEAIPYPLTLTPLNEPLRCTGCMYLDEDFVPCVHCVRAAGYSDYYRRPPEGEEEP